MHVCVCTQVCACVGACVGVCVLVLVLPHLFGLIIQRATCEEREEMMICSFLVVLSSNTSLNQRVPTCADGYKNRGRERKDMNILF